MTISFDHLLTSIAFDFATADFGLDTNTTLKLTAYNGSPANPPVGSATSQAVGEGWGLGALGFTSAAPFSLVTVVILSGAGSDFLADNFSVDALPGVPATVPEPVGLGIIGVVLIVLVRRWTRR